MASVAQIITSPDNRLRFFSRFIRGIASSRSRALAIALCLLAGSLAAALVAGAAEPAVWRFDALHGKRFLRPADAVAIALADADRTRIDVWVTPGGHPKTNRVETGPAWARIFGGDPAKDPVMWSACA